MWAMTAGQKPLLHRSPAFSPHVPVVNTEELKDRMISPLKSSLVPILSPGTQPCRRPGVFLLGHNHEKCIFFLLWWKNDGFALLKHSCWLIHGTKEGDIQGGQHAAFCFPARVRVWQRARLEGGGTAQCSR